MDILLRKTGIWRFEMILTNAHWPLSLYQQQTTSHLSTIIHLNQSTHESQRPQSIINIYTKIRMKSVVTDHKLNISDVGSSLSTSSVKVSKVGWITFQFVISVGPLLSHGGSHDIPENLLKVMIVVNNLEYWNEWEGQRIPTIHHIHWMLAILFIF